MIRFRRLIIVYLVTGITVSRRAGILCSVTGDTGSLLMRTGQRECGSIVIIFGRNPRIDRVAERAIVRESAGFVVRLTGRGKICAMTGITIA